MLSDYSLITAKMGVKRVAISFDTEGAAAMQRALAASSLRQQVLSDNIANVNTPNFKRSDVLFGDQLQQAVDKEEKRSGKQLSLMGVS